MAGCIIFIVLVCQSIVLSAKGHAVHKVFKGQGKFKQGIGAYRGDTPIGKLMHDFSCTDAADLYHGTLADRVRFFKRARRESKNRFPALFFLP